MAAQLTRVPEPLHELRPEIPRELSELIMRCLEKIPDDRPQTAIELQRQLDGVSTPRGAVMADDPLPELERHPGAARGALIGAAVVVALSVGAYLTVVDRSDDRAAAAAADSVRSAAPAPETTRAKAPAGRRPAASPSAQAADTAALIAAAMSASSKSGSSQPAAGAAGTPAAPNASAAPPPVVLSRADSLAIAQAVQARLEAERAAEGDRTRAISDSLRIVYQRAFTDSIERVVAEIRASVAAATEGAGAGGGQRSRTTIRRNELPSPLPPRREGERRVVIVPFSQGQSGGRSSSGGAGDRIADSLRTLLAGREGMVVVPESTTREIARIGRGVPTMIGTMLDAPAVVTGSYSRRGDSLVVRMQVTCVTCAGLGTREAVVPFDEPMGAVGRLHELLVRDLDRVRWTAVSSRGFTPQVTPIPRPPGTRIAPRPPEPPPG